MIHAMLRRMNRYRGLKILRVLWMILKQKKGPQKKSTWSLYLNDGQTPRQKNTYNCGVFICLFCYLISKHQPVKFDQSIIPSFRSHMAISIVECETYKINHLRHQNTIKKVPSGFYFKMVSRQSDHNDVLVAKLKHKLRHEILELLGNCNIEQFKFNHYQRQDIELFSIASVLLQGFTLVAAMLMMVIA